jgi:hypothetical protein
LTHCADQPKPYCLVSPYGFAVKLIEKTRAGACDGFGPDGFNADPEVGLSPYYQPGKNGESDYAKGSLAIQTAEVGTLFFTAKDAGVDSTATDGKVYSLGKFSSETPDDQGFCSVPELSKTHIVLAALPDTPDDPETPDVDESAPGQPAQDITLEWTNLRVYVTAANYGTQFEGDLTDTRVSPAGDTCTISYHALGLSPIVQCNAFDADGNPIINDDGSYQLDLSACDPLADPEHDRPVGSGITVNTDYICDPVTAYCAIAGDTLPAIK